MFDYDSVAWDGIQFNKSDWAELYGYIKEEITSNDIDTRGFPVNQNVFVDAYHAGYRMIHRLHMGIIISLNKPSVVW